MGSVPPAGLGKEIVKTVNAVRFASVDAINHTAYQARKAVQKSLKENFTLRNTWTEKGIRVELATRQKEYAEVFSRDWYIAQHEEGDQRTPPKQNTLGEPAFEIPTRSFFDLITQVNRKRIIPKKFKPKGLLRVRLNEHKPFVLRGNRTSGVYVRTSKERNSIRLLYGFRRKKQRIQRKSWFYKAVQVTYDKNMERNYEQALKKILTGGG